jgi:hypothetical protein
MKATGKTRKYLAFMAMNSEIRSTKSGAAALQARVVANSRKRVDLVGGRNGQDREERACDWIGLEYPGQTPAAAGSSLPYQKMA